MNKILKTKLYVLYSLCFINIMDKIIKIINSLYDLL